MLKTGIKHKILLSPLSEPGSGMRGDSCLPVLSQAQDSRMSFKTLGKHLDARRSLTLLKECKSLSLSHLILGHKLEDHLYALMKSFRTAATPALGYYGIPLTNGLSALNYHARIYRPLLPFPLVSGFLSMLYGSSKTHLHEGPDQRDVHRTRPRVPRLCRESTSLLPI